LSVTGPLAVISALPRSTTLDLIEVSKVVWSALLSSTLIRSEASSLRVSSGSPPVKSGLRSGAR
jgi:hypothetical protein